MQTKESINQLNKILLKINEIMDEASSKDIDLFKEDKSDKIPDFKEQKKIYLKNMFKNQIQQSYTIGKELMLNFQASNDGLANKKNIINKTLELLDSMINKEKIDFFKDKKKFGSLYENIKLLNDLFLEKNASENIKKTNRFKVPKNVPLEIRNEVTLEINEIEKCNDAGCYRAAVVLCGRLLEIALHRKYYEMTNNDLLETNPNIGLGKLIAKLKEDGVEEIPGLTQQIHLINNVRITSVHKKSTDFYPSKAQAEAIILYTIDAVERLFS